MSGGFRDAFPIVYTRDVPRAVAFYRGELGFEERYRWPAEGEPEFVVLRLERFELGVATASALQELLGRQMGDELRFELCLYADDVDAAVERLRARGVEVLREPADMPWGERMAYVADPDGNPIQLASRSDAGRS